jgi:Gram-negative bacterial TonB protein C-terminal
MLRPNMLLVNLIALPASLFAGLAWTSGPGIVIQHSPGAAVESTTISLGLELDRAILILNRGLEENWGTRDQYLAAFESTPSTDHTGRPVADAKKYVECAIGAHLRSHQLWDEGPPIEVEVHRTIVEFTKRRDEAEQGKANELPLPLCAAQASPKVTVSAGVASAMLKTKVAPVYPVGALKDHVSEMIVLHATISAEGRVDALTVVSGPTSLRQAVLDAVRQWTYRPYLLDNKPVQVETTIDIVFPPNR